MPVVGEHGGARRSRRARVRRAAGAGVESHVRRLEPQFVTRDRRRERRRPQRHRARAPGRLRPRARRRDRDQPARLAATEPSASGCRDRDRRIARRRRPRPRRYERDRRARRLDVEGEPAGRHRRLPSRRIDQVPVPDARRRQRVGEHGRRRRLPGRCVLVARARRRRRRQLSRHRVRRLGPARPRDRSQLSASCPASP